MSTAKKLRRWADSDFPTAKVVPRIPARTTFRQMQASAAVAARIEAETQRLSRYFDRIGQCHAVITAPHRHHRHGRHYTLHLELSVPGERLVISHEPGAHAREEEARLSKRNERQASHQDINVVIREAFDAARRRLEDYARHARGDVKLHEPAG